MRRAITSIVAILFLASLVLFEAGSSNGTTCGDNASVPPFIASGSKPNILIVLDNSGSMVQDFYGAAAGGASAASKSVIAQEALRNIIGALKDRARVGLMTFNLPANTNDNNLDNSYYFVSYDQASYCPDPDDATAAACQAYCLNPSDTTSRDACSDGCRSGNTNFTTAFTDTILDTAANRPNYCPLIYPKTNSFTIAGGTFTETFYYKSGPYMEYWRDTNPAFLWGGGGYTTGGTASDTYHVYSKKTGTSDSFSGYENQQFDYTYSANESDIALGFRDFGKRVAINYIGQTWSGGVATSPFGYLRIDTGDLDTGARYQDLINLLTPKTTNTEYMSCLNWDKDTCSYIINAGGTPSYGALKSALNYFGGTYKKPGSITTLASPIENRCQKNYIIFVTDGLPSVDKDGNASTDTVKLTGEVVDLLNTSSTVSKLFPNPKNKNQSTSYQFHIPTYVLGLGLIPTAKQNLNDIAVAGDTKQAYFADHASELADALNAIVADVLGRTASGTSVSILSEKVQQGANMMQAVFYPSKFFGAKEISWVGYLYNYWFYVSKKTSNIREDSVHGSVAHDYKLNLLDDYGLTFTFTEETGLKVQRWLDDNKDGDPTVAVDGGASITLDDVNPLWEAGKVLYKTAPSQRNLYTVNPTGTGLMPFIATNPDGTFTALAQSTRLGGPTTTYPDAFPACLATTDDNTARAGIINYLWGTDKTGCRDRTVTTGTAPSTYTGTWKLGDITYSTPRVESDYMFCFNSSAGTYTSDVCETAANCSTGQECKKKESIVFVGANDGMLHAFKTGVLSKSGMNLSAGDVAELVGIPDADMGKELWAFIPKNSLPYLRCLLDPNYCHLDYVDLTPYVVQMYDGSKVLRKVLIGGMRLGGGAWDKNGTTKYCLDAQGHGDGQTCTQASSCPATENASCSTAYFTAAPPDTCSTRATATLPTDTSTCTGVSSYFALDVTNPENPQFLWEFSHPKLGYTYSGPAVIHRTETVSGVKQDRYFVMFLSGPTERSGRSHQDLQAFVLSLGDDLKVSQTYTTDFGSDKVSNAFGGRLFTNGLDMNGDGNTDFVFFGYTYNTGSDAAPNWHGGLAKIWTGGLDPAGWDWNVKTYFNISQVPVTSKVEVARCFQNWYVFAGSGRYFFKDDNYGPQADWIMAAPLLCDFNNDCTTGSGNFNWTNKTPTDVCSNLQGGDLNNTNWFIDLEMPAADAGYYKERVITDPTVSSNSNIVFFTTTEPTTDVCGYGGLSRVWGLNCATGESILGNTCAGFTVPKNTGVLYLQTSTGAIHPINPAAADSPFSESDGRATEWMDGIPPESAPPLVNPSGPKTGVILHWNEK